MVTAATKQAMKQVLTEIQDGTYAKNWIAEDKAGRSWFMAQRKKEQEHQIEQGGRRAAQDDAVPRCRRSQGIVVATQSTITSCTFVWTSSTDGALLPLTLSEWSPPFTT